MSPISKITWAIIIAVLAVSAIASQFIRVREAGTQIGKYTANANELVQDTLVGQTFVAPKDNLSGVSIMFATYSGRENTEPVKFHLRQSIDDPRDLRTGTVHPSQLGDNQFYRFEFEPIPDSKGETFFFFVVSPTSSDGNAITVDINTEDPYHLGTAFLVRGQGSAVTDPAVIDRSGKQTVDVVFETYHTVPLRIAAVNKANAAVRLFVGTWDERKHVYLIWTKAIVPALLFFIVLYTTKQTIYTRITERLGKKKFTLFMLIFLFAAAIGMRYLYATELPITDDEGNYLYDARSLRQGILAGGDGYVKAPLVILWIALWQMMLGDTVFAGRMSSVFIGALTMLPIYFLAKDLWSSKAVTREWLPQYISALAQSRIRATAGWGRRIGIVAASIWAFFGSAIVFNIYVHTQAVALFLGISGLAVLLMALRGTTPRMTFLSVRKFPSSSSWFVFAGILLGVAVASRKSMLALGLVPVLLLLTESRDLKRLSKHTMLVAIGFLLIIAVFVGVGYYLYGLEGVWEALGVNSAEDGIAPSDPPELVRSYSIRGMTPFFRESLPLILLSVLGLGFVSERFIRDAFAKGQEILKTSVPTIISEYVTPKLGWISAWVVFWWAWSFFSEYEGAAFMRYGIAELWYCFAGILLLVTFLPRPKSQIEKKDPEDMTIVPTSTQPGIQTQTQKEDITTANDDKFSFRRDITALLFVPLWVGGLIVFYTQWIKFHANYLAEFIPPLVVISAFGAVSLYNRLQTRLFLERDYPVMELLRRVFMVGLSAILLWSITVSNYITFLFEHTGTFSQGSVQEAAAWARENIPLDEPIFTGAAIIPYLSGHHTALDIAHPRWYAYEFTRKDTERLNTFLPSAEEMVQAYREAEWFLLEKQTGFSFLMEYTEIEAGLERDWVSVKGIENGSNTMTFYRRSTAAE